MGEKFPCFTKGKGCVARRIARNEYESHEKHILEITQIELFNKFKEKQSGVNMSISTFVQQKPWYVKPITVRDTCFYHYHVEFELYYDSFLDFDQMFWAHSPPPSTIHDLISKTICEREGDGLFYQKICVRGRKCDHCRNMTLFHFKYPINMNDQSLSTIIANWKI